MVSDRKDRARFRIMSAERNEQPVGFRRASEGVRSPVKWSLKDLDNGGGGREVRRGDERRCSGVVESAELSSGIAGRRD